ncbi:MAG: LON peptidase substrate-binding domain-containing protein [Planctomycetota bacterium]|nr:LON peptidase substrate-binding domain-containing protein [Planctomycetota bacterium]
MRVRLFPLPNFVLFPHVIRGLHIFEPRYCDMLQEALDSDKLITMATLSHGWELSYLESPSLYPMVCVGKIIRHQRTEDGRHNILLQGFARGIITEEIEETALFRRAEIQVIDCVLSSQYSAAIPKSLSVSLAQIFLCISKYFPAVPLASLLQQQAPSIDSISSFSYLLASMLPLALDAQLALLAETCPIKRISMIERWLEKVTGEPLVGDVSSIPMWGGEADKDGRDYPPNFSLN